MGKGGGLLQCLKNPATLIPTWQPQLTKEQSASLPTMHCRQEALGIARKFMGVCLTGGLARQQTQQHHWPKTHGREREKLQHRMMTNNIKHVQQALANALGKHYMQAGWWAGGTSMALSKHNYSCTFLWHVEGEELKICIRISYRGWERVKEMFSFNGTLGRTFYFKLDLHSTPVACTTQQNAPHGARHWS